jgi:hypothetical protein
MRAKRQSKKMLEEGGLLQEGGAVDPESGNEVPVGSLKEEVRDDIPAQLSEGEFVFPADVVRFIGLERLMQLRQEAKEGLAKMNAMGQMGNSEEATMDDDGDFETDIDSIMAEVEAESGKLSQTEQAFEAPTKMKKGGAVVKKSKGNGVKEFNFGGFVTKRYENEQGQVTYVPTINDIPQIAIPQGFQPTEKQISFGGVYRESSQAQKTASQQFEELYKAPSGVSSPTIKQSTAPAMPPAFQTPTIPQAPKLPTTPSLPGATTPPQQPTTPGEAPQLPTPVDFNSIYKDVYEKDPTEEDKSIWEVQIQNKTPDQIKSMLYEDKYDKQMTQNVTDLYRNYLGREPDDDGLNYWKSTFGTDLSEDEIYTFLDAANKAEPASAEMIDQFKSKQVSDLYTKFLGREVDEDGLTYWKEQFGNVVSPEEVQTFINSARDNGEQINEQELAKFHVSALYDAVFGSFEEQRELAKQFDITTQDLRQSFLDAEYFSSEYEDVLFELQNSSFNKLQEIEKLAPLLTTTFGTDQNVANVLTQELVQGKDTSSVIGQDSFDQLKNSYSEMLKTGELSQEGAYGVIKAAYDANPNSKFFKDNPDALVLFKPITEIQYAKAGEISPYGVMSNGLPVLNAKVAEQIVGRNGKLDFVGYPAKNPIGQNQAALGMVFDSWTESTAWRAGNSIFGIDFDRDIVEKQVEFEWELASGKIEKVNTRAGTTYRLNGVVVKPPIPSKGSKQIIGGVRNLTLAQVNRELTDAATKLGIDPTDKDLLTLFDEVSARTDGLYQVIGGAQQAGLTGKENVNPNNNNHFSALYKEVGDKLVPLQADFFDFSPPKKKKFLGVVGGTLGDMLTGVFSMPFLPEIIAMTGVGTVAYAGLKGAQTAALGGDLGDVAKSVGLSYLSAKVIPEVAPKINATIASALPSATPAIVSKVISTAGTNAVISAGMMTLAGKDFNLQTLIETSLLSASANTAAGEVFKGTDLSPQQKALGARILADTIVSGNFEASVQNAIIRYAPMALAQAAKDAERDKQMGQLGFAAG